MFQSAIKHKWVTSIAVNLLLFLLVNLFLFPIFNSGDDVFLLYTLSGGYGDAPTNLLYYNHVWHPVLGWKIKWWFENFPGVNWYTVFLMGLQVISCTGLLYRLFKKFKAGSALLLYLLFFCFIELRVIEWLNFSSTAWITAVAGFILLLDAVKQKRIGGQIILSVLLLLVAGLLRLHIIAAVAILFMPAFLMYTLKEYKIWGSILVLLTGLLFVLNIQHKSYYKENIPWWQQQEQYRQTLFKLGNSSGIAAAMDRTDYHDTVALNFYKSKFYIDTSFLSTARLSEIEQSLKKKVRFNSNDFFNGIYWLFVELRAYLLLLVICSFLLWRAGVVKSFFKRSLLPFLLLAGAYFFLLMFMKMTFALHMGIMTVFWIYSVLTLADIKSKTTKPLFDKNYFLFLLLLPLSWISIRIYKTDKENRQQHDRFKCMVAELDRHKDKLFVATDDLLPLNFYFVWDAPSKNRIVNLIYKDREMTFSYRSTLERYNVNDLPVTLFTNPNVLLTGKELKGLDKYYKTKLGVEVKYERITDNYKCLQVGYLKCVKGCGN